MESNPQRFPFNTTRAYGTPLWSAPEDAYRNIVEQAVAGVVQIDLDGEIVFVNEHMCSMTGYEPGELVGRSIHSITAPDCVDQTVRALEYLHAGGAQCVVEKCYVRKDGAVLYASVSINPVHDHAGRLIGTCGVIVDMTHREQLQASLESQQTRYRHLFDSIDEGFAEIELHRNEQGHPTDWTFVDVNPAFIRLTGLMDATGHRVMSLLPALEPRWLEIYDEISRTQVPRRFSEQSPRMQGRWFDAYAFPVSAPEEGRIAVLFRDVTAQKQATDALAASEHELRSVTNAVPVIVWTVASDGAASYRNARWYEYSGQPETAPFESSLDYVHPDDLPTSLEAWKASLASGAPYMIETRLRRFDGEYRWFLVRAERKVGPDGASTWYGTSTDIHERKVAQEQIGQARKQKDRAVAVLAHELRNPLTPIINAVTALRCVDASGERKHLYEIIDRQAQHMGNLLGQLLDVSSVLDGVAAMNDVEVPVAELVAEAVAANAEFIESRNQTVALQLTTGERVSCDRQRMIQALGCLVENAAKYMEPGGTITVSDDLEDGSAVIRVRDSGAGIAGADIGTIFDLFAQGGHPTGWEYNGLGIGLTLARALVEQHGGTLTVQSPGLGLGSEFIVRLRRARQGRRHPAVQDDEAFSAVRQPRKVVVVDDNKDVADTIGLCLSLVGHEVLVEYDGERALDTVHKIAPDACLLDIGMPGMDGVELCRAIRNSPIGDRVVIVAVTGWSHPEERDRTQSAGFDAHIVKPVDPAALMEVLDHLLAQRTAAAAARAG